MIFREKKIWKVLSIKLLKNNFIWIIILKFNDFKIFDVFIIIIYVKCGNFVNYNCGENIFNIFKICRKYCIRSVFKPSFNCFKKEKINFIQAILKLETLLYHLKNYTKFHYCKKMFDLKWCYCIWAKVT